jgi:hypothetical protein
LLVFHFLEPDIVGRRAQRQQQGSRTGQHHIFVSPLGQTRHVYCGAMRPWGSPTLSLVGSARRRQCHMFDDMPHWNLECWPGSTLAPTPLGTRPISSAIRQRLRARRTPGDR